MTLRRICTIDGRSYRLTGHCEKCGDPMWTTTDAPPQQAGCTDDQCRQSVVRPASTSTPASDIRHPTSRSLSSGHYIMASTKPWYAPLVRVLVMCVVLATLQWLTATNYDLALQGEAGMLAGMVLVYSLAEFIRT